MKFGSEGSSRLVRVLDELVTAGEVDAWVPRAVAELAHRWPIVAIDVDGLPWTEVDCPEDLYYAEQVVASDLEAWLLPPLPLGAAQLSQAAVRGDRRQVPEECVRLALGVAACACVGRMDSRSDPFLDYPLQEAGCRPALPAESQ